MEALENIFVSICIIGLCVITVAAFAGLLVAFVWAIVTGIKEGLKDGK